MKLAFSSHTICRAQSGSTPNSPTGRGQHLPLTLLSLFLTIMLGLVCPHVATAQVVTNWVAYNDFGPNYTTPTADGWITAPGVSGYDMGFGPGGMLTNWPAGQFAVAELPPLYPLAGQAALVVSRTGGANGVFGLPAGPTVPFPDSFTGTPAYDLFHGIVDMSNLGSLFGVGSGQSVLLTFTNLNPTMHYKFRGSVVRNGQAPATHPIRWTLSSIVGAASFVDAHSSGVGMLTSASSLAGLTLTNGQAAFQSGINIDGMAVGWDDIVPAADGTFTVVNQDYEGVTDVDNSSGHIGYVLNAIVLTEYGQSALLTFVTQPASSLTTTQLVSFTLSAKAQGTAAYYQWYKDTTPVGANLPTLTVSSPEVSDSGSYICVATNSLGSATSTVAHVTVVADTFPPRLLTAVGYPAFDPGTLQASLTSVTLHFNERLDPATIDANAFGFIISGLLNFSSAVPANGGFDIILTTDAAQTENTLYTVTVPADVHDLIGNPVGADNTAQFRAWVSSPGNGILYEAFHGVLGTTDIPALTNSPDYPNNPFVSSNLWAADSRVVFPDDLHENYGSRMRGLFIPPISGDWVFFIRSDDPGQVYLNPNGPAASGKQLILNETGCCGDWNKYNSATFTLSAGQGYYIETLHKETGGGDYIKVAARLAGTGFPTLGTANTAVDPASIDGPSIGFPYAPLDIGGALTVSGPADLTILENHVATFTVSASNPSDLPIVYQWSKDGTPIDGANRPSYSFLATAFDDGSALSVQVSKLGSTATSTATLTVQADTIPPTVLSVRGYYLPNTLVVTFSEPVDPTSAQDPLNYLVSGGLTVTQAVLDPSGQIVRLTLDGVLTPGATYQVTMNNVTDIAGNILVGVSVDARVFDLSPGFLRYDYFAGLSTLDNNINNTLLADPRYPDRPTATYYAAAFDSLTVFPDSSHEGFGAHLTGFFIPPASGNYIFYLKSDDSSQLFLNPTGADPAGKVMIQEETGCCGDFAKLPSPPQALTAGQQYFIEANMKEGTGGDYIQVAAKLDTDPAAPDSLSPISGAHLATLVDPVGSSITITQQPLSRIVGVRFAAAPHFDFTQGDGSWAVVSHEPHPGPWIYNPTNSYWDYLGVDPCGGPFLSSLQSPLLTMTADGDLDVTFVHRYSFEGPTVNGADQTAYDGGQVQLSVNGGPFTVVPGANFSANGYTGTIQGTSLLDDKQGFTDTSTDFLLMNYLTSTATLGTFFAGDTILIRFVASQDECSRGFPPNWEITTVDFSAGIISLQAAKISFQVGASSLLNGAPNSLYFYQWQSDTGAGFQDLLGQNASTLLLPFVTLDEGGSRFRVLVYSPGSAATSEVATLTLTLPLAIGYSGGTATISWPDTTPAFNLQQSSGLLSWIPVTTAPLVSGGLRTVPVVVPATGQKFYRLIR